MQRWSATAMPAWDFDAWRQLARHAWQAQVPPAALDWSGGVDASLFAAPSVLGAPEVKAPPRVTKAFVELAQVVLCHRSEARFALLYQLLWRLLGGERELLGNPADAQVLQATALAQEVRRDTHKMKAFVRFRQAGADEDDFVAWFEPDHFIVDRIAPFFARRFAGMRWHVLTPYRSARWDGEALHFGGGAQKADAPADDAQEELWAAYYASIFNPARLNTRMMQQEMPAKYWKNLPEARLLPGLVQNAGARVREMAERAPQAPRRKIPQPRVAATPATDSDAMAALNRAVQGCRACPLWSEASQAVVGEGPDRARIMVIGEQPGDEEDIVGRPFVGPAGRLLERALADAGIERSAIYLTNAVKHFRFVRQGKLRLHKTPAQLHVEACQHWLQRELALQSPSLIVCLGATATGALLGTKMAFSTLRGQWLSTETGVSTRISVHPAWVLRQAEGSRREQAYQLLLTDLQAVRERADALHASGV
ncbi:MAG: UdgX family uracil-DNA binding protein [Stenotrophomonas sp.]